MFVSEPLEHVAMSPEPDASAQSRTIPVLHFEQEPVQQCLDHSGSS
jgi:hypothetical protein